MILLIIRMKRLRKEGRGPSQALAPFIGSIGAKGQPQELRFLPEH